MKKKIFIAAIWIILVSMSTSIYSQTLTVGEEVLIPYESKHPYAASSKTNEIVWSQEISYTEKTATYIAVHFSQFNLAVGDKLVLRSPNNERVWEYTSEDNDRGEFWSIPINGDRAIIEIVSSNSGGSFGYVIDKFARGFTQTEIQSANGTESICGEDDTEEAKCYEVSEPVVYEHSRAVARLLKNGTIHCTGFLVGDEGHLMTCQHCIQSQNVANNISVEMMAEGANCSVNCQNPLACPGTIVADEVTLVQNSDFLDYALVSLPTNVSSEYGYLTMRESGAIVDEQIYIPQHPAGWGKRIAFVSDNTNDTDGFIHVQSITQVGYCSSEGNRVSYYGDTRGGSSGSPVISYEDHCVVAVHGCGGCPNDGANTSLIIADLSYIPNNAICGQVTCGSGDDIHIYTNTIYSTDIEVTGNIFVHTGAQLTVTGKLEFGEDKGIIVSRGAKLVVDGGHLTKCPDADDWKGIIVKGNSNSAQPNYTAMPSTNEAGVVWVKNNSLIEWARTAISTNYYGSWTNQDWGGLVHCENSEFLNNRRVAEFMKYDFQNKSKFINCTMDGNSTISGTTVGVTIWDCDGITFNRCRFYNMEGMGILSYDSGTIVKDGNDFHHNKRGISNRSTYPFSAYLEVGDANSDPNYFVDNWFHIESYASNKLSGLKIINNEFFDANSAVWLVGPSKYLVESNSFTNSTGGVVSLHSGAMNNNQHNYVQNNGFNTIEGVVAYGKNRELQILCNAYQNTSDNRITQSNSGTEPGEIRRFQGKKTKAAGNCFTNPVNQGDINTIGWTTHFYYYHKTEALCEIPVTPGNYTPVSTRFGDCSQGEDPEDPPNKEDWTKVLKDIKEKEDNGDTLSEDYYILLELKEEILLYLLEEALNEGDIGTALILLSEDNTTFSQMARDGTLMNEGMYDEAEVVLNSLSEEDSEMSDFKQIQAINIARLRAIGIYELSSTDESYLESISESDMGVKAYARSLLALLTGKEYTDELILEDGRFEFRSQPSSKLIEGFSIAPNPMNELFTISIDKEYFDMPVNITISDINGRIIYNKTSEKNANVNINSENWQSGLYFLRVSNAVGEVIYTSKLVKQ